MESTLEPRRAEPYLIMTMATADSDRGGFKGPVGNSKRTTAPARASTAMAEDVAAKILWQRGFRRPANLMRLGQTVLKAIAVMRWIKLLVCFAVIGVAVWWTLFVTAYFSETTELQLLKDWFG